MYFNDESIFYWYLKIEYLEIIIFCEIIIMTKVLSVCFFTPYGDSLYAKLLGN